MANDVVRRSRARILLPLALVLLAVLFCLVFVRPSTASTGPDQVALHYQGRGFHLEEVRQLHRPLDPGLRRSR